MSTAEQTTALLDVQRVVNEYGSEIIVHLTSESGIIRDAYGGIKKKAGTGTEYHIHAFPITYNPTEKQLEKMGIRERVDVVAYTAKKDWSDDGYTYNDIYSTQDTLEIEGEKFEIKTLARFSQFGDEWLYYLFGGLRK